MNPPIQTPIPLDTAREYAEKLRAVLLQVPGCRKVEIAGSVRRGKGFVGDLDFVVMAEDRLAIVNRLLAPAGWRLDSDGQEVSRIFTRSGIQVDIFFARIPESDLFAPVPTNWGSVLLCRTGSVAHNIYLVEHAKIWDLRWHPQQGIYDAQGNLLASETEESIFSALHLAYIEPDRRER